jgi:hypothetical protein
MAVAVGLVFAALVALKIGFWILRLREVGGPGPDPHHARALEDSFKETKRRKRGHGPADGRQVAGEECIECEATIVAENEATACGVCDALLHLKSCAKRHVCKNVESSASAPPYRERPPARAKTASF